MEAVNSTNPVLRDLENQFALMQNYIKTGDIADLEKVMANISSDYSTLEATDPAALAQMVGLTNTLAGIFSPAWNSHVNGNEGLMQELIQKLQQPGSPEANQLLNALNLFDSQVDSGIIT